MEDVILKFTIRRFFFNLMSTSNTEFLWPIFTRDLTNLSRVRKCCGRDEILDHHRKTCTAALDRQLLQTTFGGDDGSDRVDALAFEDSKDDSDGDAYSDQSQTLVNEKNSGLDSVVYEMFDYSDLKKFRWKLLFSGG